MAPLNFSWHLSSWSRVGLRELKGFVVLRLVSLLYQYNYYNLGDIYFFPPTFFFCVCLCVNETCHMLNDNFLPFNLWLGFTCLKMPDGLHKLVFRILMNKYKGETNGYFFIFLDFSMYLFLCRLDVSDTVMTFR